MKKFADSQLQPVPATSPRFEIISGSPNANFAVRNLWPQSPGINRSENILDDLDLFSTPTSRLRRTAARTGFVPFHNGNGIGVGPESSPTIVGLEEPAEPYLKATRLSNLSAMSELDLATSNDIDGSGAVESRQPETTVGGCEAQLPPHLRVRQAPVGHHVNNFNSSVSVESESQVLPTFTLTTALMGPPLPGIVAPYAPAAGETASDRSDGHSSAVRSVPTFSSAIGGFTPAVPTMMSRASIQRPAPAATGSVVNTVSQWNNFAAQPQVASNRPSRTAPGAANGSYDVSLTAITPAVIESNMENTLYFSEWPTVDMSRLTAKPRTVVITEMPEEATLAMVSRICKNTGLVEKISLLPNMSRAVVWYIEAADAKKFYDKTGNGIVLDYERGGKAAKKTVFVEMRKEIDVLGSALRARVTDAGQSRVVRIVGWERGDLEQAAGTKNGTLEALLKTVAVKCVLDGKTEHIESVAAHINAGGHWEATIVFAGMKEAYFALGTARRIPSFEACNITFGRDP